MKRQLTLTLMSSLLLIGCSNTNAQQETIDSTVPTENSAEKVVDSSETAPSEEKEEAANADTSKEADDTTDSSAMSTADTSQEAEKETAQKVNTSKESPETTDSSTQKNEEVTGPTYIDGILIVNKGYGLPKDYAPGEDPEAVQALEEMVAAAAEEGITLTPYSGFRSYNYQASLYNRYVNMDGQEAADTYSARPGHSEHQTGLAFDIGGDDPTYYTSTQLGVMEEGIWMAENAHRFGFILRYPRGKEHITGYQYEPWHFRYVGKEHAQNIYESGLTLDEYLGAVAPDYR